MLSFDITDRNVRIIKGTESNGKIKIQASATLDLEEGLIERGIPKDPVLLSTKLNGILKLKRIADREAIMSISSNQTIFKELTVPNVKGSEFSKAVSDEMQKSVSVVDDTYSISYTIVKKDGNLKENKDNKDENAPTDVTVLATACPHNIIDAYLIVFKYLNISLKSIVVANNCITKVLLADSKLKQKMPFMAVQIDKNFISMNVYQDNQLSFSRFASIDDSDYSESEDYIMDAIHDNVFRMLQFQRNRSSETINHIVFYGDTSERYRELADDMEQMGLTSSVIAVPPLITGYENLEFSNYANAIGAMFKRDKDTEKINLLELGGTAAIVNTKLNDDKSFGLMLGAVGGGAVAIVALISIVLGITNHNLEKNIETCQQYINSQEAIDGLAKHDNRTAMLENVRAYKDAAKVASDAYKSRPILTNEILTKLEELATGVDASIKYSNINYVDGILTIPVTANGSNEPVQTIPNTLAKAIADDGTFYNVDYVGYNLNTNTTDATVVTNPDGTTTTIPGTEQKTIDFNLVMYLKSDVDSIVSDYEVNEETIIDNTVTDGTTNQEESAN
ncbi:MAG: pilus assembly protein PilM [Oscillospiraceae bacterium]